MNKFVRNLLTEWRKQNLPFSDETIVAAVSGGADSVSLMLALDDLQRRKKLNLKFVIAHFNHNLRGIESDQDEKFVKDLAKKLKFEFLADKGEISTIGNLEQNARQARYEFLKQVVEKTKAYAVLTAHTKNDQAETFLLNLVRGSGLDGLAGMKDSQFLTLDFQPQIRLSRPLLNWAKRKDTEEYCRENNIEFREDSMNTDLKFARVRIRKEIIPSLEKLNPRIIDTLSQTANILRADAESLKIKVEKPSEILLQSELKLLSKSMQMRLLRSWLEKNRGNLRQLELKHFDAILQLINSHKSGRIVELPKGEKVIKKGGKIFFEKRRVEKS